MGNLDDELRKLVDGYTGPITAVPAGKRGPPAPKKATGNQAAGRPAKSGDRFPSGQLKPEIAPAELARVRAAVLRGVLDKNFGSQVGLLLIMRRLTPPQAAAAFRVGEIYGRFEGSNGLRRSTRSPSYESGISTASRGGDTEHQDEQAAAAEEQRQQDTEAAWLAVQNWLSGFSRAERAQLEALCVEDISVSSLLLPDIAKMLDGLGQFLNSAKARGKKRKKKKGATLMLVTKDHRAAPKPAFVRRADHDRSAWLKVQRKLSPTMSDDQLNEAYRIFVAMKDREQFNDEKGETPR